ncbi:MAG TPA: hypothetical protein PLE74_10660 [Candidatus Cloacimonadota bacterium]|nr:hypothetical protein [Candidatus Cloacimonadota bacterium]
MNQNDKIEAIKNDTFSKYNSRDGVLDIVLGFGILFYVLCKVGDFFTFFAFFGIFGPMIARRLRERFIYPRIGIALFHKLPKSHYKRVILMGAFILVITMLGLALNFHDNRMVVTTYQFSYPWVFLAIGVFIASGILRYARFYIYGLMMLVPMIFIRLFNMNPIYLISSIALLALAIYISERMEMKDRAENINYTMDGYMKFVHYFFIILAVCFGIYLLLRLYDRSLYDKITYMKTNFMSVVLGSIISLILTMMGITYRAYRIVVYAFLLAVSIFIPLLISGLGDQILNFLAISGIIVLISGIIVFRNFLRENPVIEVKDGTE